MTNLETLKNATKLSHEYFGVGKAPQTPKLQNITWVTETNIMQIYL